jgi:NAD(P)-dependent dehydrogenase (short-subunit alcohol dehydrogenase family)
MHGKIVLITGADGGIGRETTKAIAKKGATIVMACIDLTEAQPVYEAIKKESGNTNIEMMQLNLASLSAVREFVSHYSQKYQRLDVLINNAGIYCTNREETQDGFEKTIGTNYLGPFLFTNLLLPFLTHVPEGRIINVASNAYFQGKIDLNDLHLKKKYHGFKAYASSKLAIVLFTQELAERLKDTGITVNAVHPGHVATNIWNMWPGKWYQALLFKIIRWFAMSPEDAAQTSVYLARSDEVKGITGKYFEKKNIKEKVSPKSQDIRLQKELWQLSERLTGLA